MRHLRDVVLLTAALVMGPPTVNANIIAVDFESFGDGTLITTQIPGLTFSNATVITAGISLNEFEFPPRSGTNVIFDDGGPITISFSATLPVLSFSAYFTYLTPLTLMAFDLSNNPMALASSLFASNLALSGDPGSSPNELLQLGFNSGISKIVITGDNLGSSFTLDDLTVTTVPEPSSIILLLTLAVGTLRLANKRNPIRQ